MGGRERRPAHQHEPPRQRGAARRQRAVEVDPVHPRHVDVAEDDVEGRRGLVEQAERVGAVRRDRHLVGAPEHAREHGRERGFVLDQQQPPARLSRAGGRWGHRRAARPIVRGHALTLPAGQQSGHWGKPQDRQECSPPKVPDGSARSARTGGTFGGEPMIRADDQGRAGRTYAASTRGTVRTWPDSLRNCCSPATVPSTRTQLSTVTSVAAG